MQKNFEKLNREAKNLNENLNILKEQLNMVIVTNVRKICFEKKYLKLILFKFLNNKTTTTTKVYH